MQTCNTFFELKASLTLESCIYINGLYFLIGADCNELKLDDILSLSPQLKQCVDKPTHNDSILDPIITDLHPFYQTPRVEPPLDPDSDAGEPSDHKCVVMTPLNTIDNKKKVESKEIETRVFSDTNFSKMGQMLANFDWKVLNNNSSISDKMYFFHNTVLDMFRECFPLKRKRIFTQSEPFINDVILKMRRKKRREFHKHRMSEKYIQLDQRYRELLSKSMKSFYKRKVKPLRTSNPRAWYRNIKQLIGYDAREENPTVESLSLIHI